MFDFSQNFQSMGDWSCALEVVGVPSHLYETIAGDLTAPVRRGEVSYRLASAAALCSALAYFDAPPVRAPVRARVFEYGSFQATIIRGHGPLLVCAFRGSELVTPSPRLLLADWLSTLGGAFAVETTCAFRIPGTVHGGFHRGVVDLLKSGLADELNAHAAAHDGDRTILLTGHSKGAAMAAIAAGLAAASPRREPWHRAVAAAYVFSSPKVFDARAVDSIRWHATFPIVAFANRADPVPHLPPERVGDLPGVGFRFTAPSFVYGPGDLVHLTDVAATLVPHGRERELIFTPATTTLGLLTRFSLFHPLGGATVWGTSLPLSGYLGPLWRLRCAEVAAGT
jgi:hypothetical protein